MSGRCSTILANTALAVVVGMVAAPARAQAPTEPSHSIAQSDAESPPAPGVVREGALPPGSARLYIAEQPGNTLLASDYIGRNVYGPAKQKVGTVTNLLVDTTGRVVGIVMDVGGFLGIGAKEIALAFEALFPVLEDDKEAFFVEMTKEQLAAAPAFKRSR
jgi:PRC-barrel domain